MATKSRRPKQSSAARKRSAPAPRKPASKRRAAAPKRPAKKAARSSPPARPRGAPGRADFESLGAPVAGDAAAALAAAAPSAALGFSQFLTGVAEAMITAQERLDLQTEAYLSGSSSPRPLPTLFRLPRLKATMKCAIERSEGKELNLLFYSSTTAASALQQQTIDFELMAVAPPPEAGLVPGEYVPLLPRVDLVLDRSRRADLLALLQASAEARGALGLEAEAAADQHAEVILWELVRPGQGDTERLVLAASSGSGAKLCLIGIRTVNASTTLAVQPFELGALGGRLGEFLGALAARQRQIAGSAV
jgi:hypothetical protein